MGSWYIIVIVGNVIVWGGNFIAPSCLLEVRSCTHTPAPPTTNGHRAMIKNKRAFLKIKTSESHGKSGLSRKMPFFNAKRITTTCKKLGLRSLF